MALTSFVPRPRRPVGMNIDLREMSDGWLDDLDVRKPHGNIIRERPRDGRERVRTSSLVVSLRTDSGAWPTELRRELYRWQHRDPWAGPV